MTIRPNPPRGLSFSVCTGSWGGSRSNDPLEPKPLLKQSLKAFRKASKALFKTTGSDKAFQFLKCHRGKAFLLKQYGVEMHLPAVAAEVCIDEGINKTLHDMLLTLREIKQGPHKGSIKSSAAALPRIEPWLQIIAKTPTHLLTIMQRRCNNRLISIEQQGERGDGRDSRTHFFLSSVHTAA